VSIWVADYLVTHASTLVIGLKVYVEAAGAPGPFRQSTTTAPMPTWRSAKG